MSLHPPPAMRAGRRKEGRPGRTAPVQAGSSPHPARSAAAEAKPGLEPGASTRKKRRSCAGPLREPAGVQLRLTQGSTRPSSQPPPALGSQCGPPSNPSWVDQPRGARRASGARGPTTPPRRSRSQRPASPLGTCCALLTLLQSPSLPTLENYTLPLLLASLSWGRAEAGEEGDRKGVGT